MRETRAMIVAAAVLAVAGGVVSMAAPVPAAGKFIVHEWGTFSSFSGSDGIPTKFYPEGGADLPSFVYSSVRYLKSGYAGTLSLETPVLYFYADRPLTAAVRADFPGGVFTEWFPQASRPPEKPLTLIWNDVRIHPGAPGPLPVVPGPKRYYAAREVDATPLRIVQKNQDREVSENERFLFYRGVGSPKTPLGVIAHGNSSFSLRVSGDAPIAAALLIEVKARQLRFRQIGSIASGPAVAVTLPPEWTTIEPVRTALVTTLVKAGLYEKEARAMVKTWESAWFGDDGARLLYILPNEWVERTLPLKVTPAPDTLLRVMVGRHDVLTPEREQEIDGLVRRTKGADEPQRKSAEATLAKLGRFQEPACAQAEQRLARRR